MATSTRSETTDMEEADGLAFVETETPVVSILIPVCGESGAILRCLRAMLSRSPAVPFEVIVAVDGARLGALERIPGLRHSRSAEPLELGAAYKAMSAMARGQFLHLLTEDCEVHAGWLDAMLALLVRFPDCAAVGAKLLTSQGLLRQAGGIVWSDGSRTGYGCGRPASAPQFDYVREVDYCSGAGLLLRAACLEGKAPFDEAFAAEIDYAEVDLAFRLRERGWTVRFCPQACVTRHGGRLASGDLTSRFPGIKGERQFLARWRHVLQGRHQAPTQCVFRAREHARHKRVALVIDHYLPQPDRDAGSRAIVQTMTQLMTMGYLVKFWPANQHYDPHYRGLLEGMGIEIVAGERWAGRFERYIRYAGADLDVVILSRPTVAVDFHELVRRHSGARLVLYGHDLHHRRMQAQAEVTGDAMDRLAADEMRCLELRLWHAMDAVIYPSDEEARVVADHIGISRAHAVPLYYFEEGEFKEPGPRPRSRDSHVQAARLLFVAGFMHSPNVDAAEWLVREVFPELRLLTPGLTLDLVGSNPNDRVRALAAAPGVTVSGSVSAETLENYYRDATLAVVPLRFGAGVKLKVLEAMVRGVPVVTTSVGAQGLPGIERCIRVADSTSGLVAAIAGWIDDPAAARESAIAAQTYVRARYSAERMRGALRRALASGPSQQERERTVQVRSTG